MRFGGDEGHPLLISWEYDDWYLGIENLGFKFSSAISNFEVGTPFRKQKKTTTKAPQNFVLASQPTPTLPHQT